MKKRDPHSVGMKGTPHFSNRVVRCLEVGGKEDKNFIRYNCHQV